MVSTTYFNPSEAIARATCSGSRGSTAPRGLPVVTAQKRHPRVQVSPRTMTVAVPAPQHSPTFGHRASSHTVCRSRRRSVSFSPAYRSPDGARTLSQSGFLSRISRAMGWLLVYPGQRGELVRGDGIDDAALGENGPHETRRGDVEGRVTRRNSGRRERLATEVRHFGGIPLFDDDGFARRTPEVHRGPRRGDVEGAVMEARRAGHAEGADLVRDVAVRGDAVGAD